LLAADMVWVNVGWVAGLWGRFEGTVPPEMRAVWVLLLPWVNLVHLVALLAFGFHRRPWQYTGTADVLRLGAGVGSASVAVWLVGIQALSLPYSRGAIILSSLVTFFLVVGNRVLARLIVAGELRPQQKGSRVLVVGAGEAGRMVVQEFRRRPDLGCVPVAFADDDLEKRGMVIAGVRVVTGRDELASAVAERRVDEIIIALPSAPRKVIGEWARLSNQTGVRVKMIPGVLEIIDGRVDLNDVRAIRPEDLLGREPIDVSLAEPAEHIRGQTVLVTGAGGSIGSELCRQMSRMEPKLLVLVGNEENQLHDLCSDLCLETAPHELVLGDVKDERRMNQIFARFRPDLVFHAAAHKHVPILESSPEEAVKNNVMGTRNVALAAMAVKTKTLVYVSTDKAVEASSVMGASKRLGEMIVQSLNAFRETAFVVVRFGNVLGSRGSVLPLFQKQVARGGPVTVTDPEVTRYFMTIEEACQLLIRTAAVGRAGEVLVLDMGTPVKILELAQNVIRLAGKEPGTDVPIVFTGLRPGEKMHEELLTGYEQVSATSEERIFMAVQRVVPWTTLSRGIEKLAGLAEAGDGDGVRAGLFSLIASVQAGQEATAE